MDVFTYNSRQRSDIMRSVINVSNVSVKLGDKLVVKNISMDISGNSFVSIVGSNGSGKSTFIKTFAGLVKYNGYININGYVLDDENISLIRQGMAIVLDDVHTQFMGETVFDDLIFNMENLRYSKSEIEKRVEYISELFRLKDILNTEVKYITNSDRQRLAIAASLTTNPSILLLDDCLHQLSVQDKKEVLDILKKYRKENKITIIMTTHNMDDVMYTDRVIVFHDGVIVQDGSVISTFKNRDLMNRNGLKVPFVILLSLKLMDKGVIDHIYLDIGKLVRELWK